VLQRKQSICHRLPAVRMSVRLESHGWVVLNKREGRNVSWGNAYQAQRPFLPRESRVMAVVSYWICRRGSQSRSHLSTSLARIHDVVLVDWTLWISAGGLHISLRQRLLVCGRGRDLAAAVVAVGRSWGAGGCWEYMGSGGDAMDSSERRRDSRRASRPEDVVKLSFATVCAT
jgi:hypothetical protein